MQFSSVCTRKNKTTTLPTISEIRKKLCINIQESDRGYPAPTACLLVFCYFWAK